MYFSNSWLLEPHGISYRLRCMAPAFKIAGTGATVAEEANLYPVSACDCRGGVATVALGMEKRLGGDANLLQDESKAVAAR